MNWVRRIKVRGSRGDEYVVALADSGAWGCSCPKWKFAKKGADGVKPDCHHIDALRDRLNGPSLRAIPKAAPLGVELDMTELAGAIVMSRPSAALSIGARFQHLDLDCEVVA